MKTFIRITAFLVASLGFAADAVAQATEPANRRTEIAAAIDTAPGAAAAMPWNAEEGAFESLSSANQRIARAVFERQSVTAGGSPPMNLDQIATIHRHGGWKAVFGRMKAAGLTSARSVRQMLAAAKRPPKTPGASSMIANPRITVVTNGAGDRIILYGEAPHRQSQPSRRSHSRTKARSR